MYFRYQWIYLYKFENDEVERILSYIWTVLCYILEYIYIRLNTKRRTSPVFAFNIQNTTEHSSRLGRMAAVPVPSTRFDSLKLVHTSFNNILERGEGA